MQHVALYRAWRPQTFADLIGQKAVVTTIRNAMLVGKVHHAYLFSGPRGTGKTSAAKLMARAVNCQSRIDGVEPCNQCENCMAVQSGATVDVLEIDAASNRGIDEIRELRENVRFAPVQVPYKVYIIDEVHMLTNEAFNALLKTLEEPPSHVLFILATTEPHKLPPTIVSRCLRFDFRRIQLDDQVDRLRMICDQEKIKIEDEALRVVARLSEGGMRDALSLLEQVTTFMGNDKIIKHEDLVDIVGGVPSKQLETWLRALHERDVPKAIPVLDEWIQSGRSAERILDQWMHMLRDLRFFKLSPNSKAWIERASIRPELAERLTRDIPDHKIDQWMKILDPLSAELRNSILPMMILEMAMFKCCDVDHQVATNQAVQISNATTVDSEIIAKIQRMELTIKQLSESIQKIGSADQNLYQKDAAAMSRMVAPAANRAGSITTKTSASSSHSLVNTQEFVENNDKEMLRTVVQSWNSVLQMIKEQRITLYAWLRDGEPTSVSNHKLLIIFKNTMHRDTIDKHANRELVEQVIQQVMGLPIRIVPVLQSTWLEAKKPNLNSQASKNESETFQLEPESEKSDWVQDAVTIFGKDAVEILDGQQ